MSDRILSIIEYHRFIVEHSKKRTDKRKEEKKKKNAGVRLRHTDRFLSAHGLRSHFWLVWLPARYTYTHAHSPFSRLSRGIYDVNHNRSDKYSKISQMRVIRLFSVLDITGRVGERVQPPLSYRRKQKHRRKMHRSPSKERKASTGSQCKRQRKPRLTKTNGR